MSRGTILAHKHTLCEAFTGFFRALATERFSEVRHWLHPELEQLIRKQCDRVGEAAFLRNLKLGLGSATQRVRLGASQAEGAQSFSHPPDNRPVRSGLFSRPTVGESIPWKSSPIPVDDPRRRRSLPCRSRKRLYLRRSGKALPSCPRCRRRSGLLPSTRRANESDTGHRRVCPWQRS